MLEALLARSESKTLEFKETAHTLSKIVQTVVAFANAAEQPLPNGKARVKIRHLLLS